jgi:bifunctional non-homologous end joining protein LigD
MFRHLAKEVTELPARSVVIDGELTACDGRGLPDFRALHFRDVRDDELCVWAFDLLKLDGRDLRELPLVERKHIRAKLVYKTRDNWLRLSETFDDGAKLLRAAEGMGLEGVISKHRGTPYRSGRSADWIKLKTADWRIANKDRWHLFEKRKERGSR